MVRVTGRWEKSSLSGEEVVSFVPFPLPPSDPPLGVDAEMGELLERAKHELSRLELAGEMVPSVDWFIYAFVRKEAVVSSQIEGTQATLTDLLTLEAAGGTEATGDVREVCNYLEALDYARSEVRRKDGLPISMRLLNEAHRRLMKGVRGSDRQPGAVRQSQNWIGGTRPGNAAYVPPPPHLLGELLSAFEKYIHAGNDLPLLIRAGLLHAQLETIHPYLDGNGRIGRLLVTLLFEHWRLLSQPLLYLSLYFKRNRSEYYRLLNTVRTEGDWEAWVAFFLDGVATIADEAVTVARDAFALIADDRARLVAAKSATVASIRLFDLLPVRPIVTTATVVRELGITKPTALKALGVLSDLGILAESTGRKRDRMFGYTAYLDKLIIGTDLILE